MAAGTIRTNYVTGQIIQDWTQTLGGTTAQIQERVVDLKSLGSGICDATCLQIGWAPGASPGSGLALQIDVYAACSISSGIADPAYRSSQPILSLTPFTEVVGKTTVNGDSNSGQAVVNVPSTTNFAIGQLVAIGWDTARAEVGVIKSIVTNTSITLQSNLVNTHTAVQADKVWTWQQVPIRLYSDGAQGFVIRLTNLDTDATDLSLYRILASAIQGANTT